MTIRTEDDGPQKIPGSQHHLYKAYMKKILIRTPNGFVQLQTGNYEISHLRDQPHS